MRLPITLIPYDAGRDIVLTVADLDRIGKSSQNDAWMIAQSHDWLAFWKNTVGVSGFPPFDLLAAAYYLEPTRFKCARVQVDIRPDRYIWTSRIFGAKALLVEANDSRSSVIYCPKANANLKIKLVDLLAATRRRAVRDAFGTWAQIPRPMR